MNAEIKRIRKERGETEKINYEPKKIEDDRLIELVHDLNVNITDLYNMKKEPMNIDAFIEKFIANIYIIIDTFNEMGVYPDYFYDEILKMNIDYKKLIKNNNDLRGNYRLFNEIDLSAGVAEYIRKGLDNGRHHFQAYQEKTIDDAFLEMLGFFQKYEIPYNQPTEEYCKKICSDIAFNHANIIEELTNSDYLFVDIECLSRLLFEYISFFVAMGIYPKKYLDEYIDTKEKEKHK